MNFDFSRLPVLLVITGATAVGKTDFAVKMAKQYQTSIISADSRQFYKEMAIGTASPSVEDMQTIPHYFVGNLSIFDYYSVSRFEQDVLALLPQLFEKNKVVIMTGGSGLYIDAVCYGIDNLPDPDMDIRKYVMEIYEKEGIESLRMRLKYLDPLFYKTADIANAKRMIRALEVSLQMGAPYSSYLTNSRKTRNFTIQKYCLTRPREKLFARINMRIDKMIEQGLLMEATSLYPYKHLNALNTVGYKELFDYLDGKLSLEQAIEDIKTHTRRYAKRQMTWFKKDTTYQEIPLQ